LRAIAILIHVPDVSIGLDWYGKAFPSAQARLLQDSGLTILDIDGFMIEIVQADRKVGVGKCGTVLYWYVNSLSGALMHFEALGAKLYRGPMDIENGMSMCQIEDSFGNLLGLRGYW